MDSRVRHAAVLALSLVALLGCSGPTATPSPSPGPDEELTIVGQLFDRIGDDGSVDKQLALDAFATMIAPIPGGVVPGGPEPHLYEVVDGTFAIEWVLEYYEELTPDQKAAFDAEMSVPAEDVFLVAEGGRRTASLMGGVPDLSDDDVVRFSVIANEASRAISSKLKRKLQMTIGIDKKPSATGIELADARRIRSVSPPDVCLITLKSALLKGGDPVAIRATIAHEVFHCFQMDIVEPVGMPKWIIEGQAEWVGETIMDGSQVGRDWFAMDYIVTPQKHLYKRTYDAVGFYEHLRQVEIDPWERIDEMLRAAPDNDAALIASGANDHKHLDSWGSSYAQTPEMGWAWVAENMWDSLVHRPVVTEGVAIGATLRLETEPLTTKYRRVTTDAPLVQVDAANHVRLHVAGYDVIDPDLIWLCTSPGQCECPDGMAYHGPNLDDGGRQFDVALAGSFDPSFVELTGFGMEEFCEPAFSPNPDGGRCESGCASSVGEPHIITVNGALYDFQAAGEFVLLRSTDGTFEIQARQEPYVGGPGVAINTAIAMRVGDQRFAVHSGASITDIQTLIDGQRVSLRDPLDVAGGGRIVPLGDDLSFDVDFGDGTLATVVSSGPYGVHVVVKPNDELRHGGTGMLAAVPAGQWLPPLPDGSTIARPDDRHQRYEELYVRFADAWRIDGAASLFDYEPGTSTDTYTVRPYPIEEDMYEEGDLTSQQRQAGEDACATVADRTLKDQCVFDVGVTGESTFADSYEAIETTIAAEPPATQGPEPTPAAALIEILPEYSSIQAADIDSDGRLYVAAFLPDSSAAVAAVDAETGQVLATRATVEIEAVISAAGSAWGYELDDPNGCSLTRLDGATLETIAVIDVPCFAWSAIAELDDYVYVRDSGDSSTPPKLFRVDPATNDIDPAFSLEMQDGDFLLGSDAALIWHSFGESGGVNGWVTPFHRLVEGASASESLGTIDAFVSASFYAADDGVWWDTDTGAVFRSGPDSTTDRTLAHDGVLTGATSESLLTSGFDDGAGRGVVWAYPIDGGPATVVGSASFAYGNQGWARLVTGDGYVIQLGPGPDGVGSELMMEVLQRP